MSVGTRTLPMEQVTPATRLLEKRRQMFEVAEALEAKKQEFAKKEEIFKKREELLKKRDLELQESLIKFSKFLQENDIKRNKAEQKAAKEIRERIEKEKEIEVLQDEVDLLKHKKDALIELLEKKMLRYQQYLEHTTEATEDFHEVADLLGRYATLDATNQDLRQQQESLAVEFEGTRMDLQAYVKQKTNEILNLNNQISRMRKELELVQRDTLDLESKKDYNLNVLSNKTLEYGQVCMATDNLFQRCLEKSHIAHPQESNTLTQLEVIGNYVSDVSEVLKLWRQQVRRGAPTATGAAALGLGGAAAKANFGMTL